MMMDNQEEKDFAGLNGFVWFTGIVEDRQDPLKLGRVRVRIIGWHDFDENLVPTESLPWAQILHPAVGYRSFTSIKEGEWVTGYFLDGKNAQEPVIMGTYPGIINEQTKIISVTKNPEAPTLPPGVQNDVIDESSLPPMARGKIKETFIDVTNNNLAHVCDITVALRKDLALVRNKFSTIVNKIRSFIRAIIDRWGGEPSGEISKLISLAKKILHELKYIRDVLDEIRDLKEVLIEYARRVRAMIDYILSLPAKLIALLRDCLQSFLGAVTTVLKELFTFPGLEKVKSDAGIDELVDTVEKIVEVSRQAMQSAQNLLNVPNEVIGVLSTPASQEDVDEIGEQVATYIENNVPNQEGFIDSNFFRTSSKKRP